MKLGRLDETTSTFLWFLGFLVGGVNREEKEILANVREKEGENVGKVRRVAEKKEERASAVREKWHKR